MNPMEINGKLLNYQQQPLAGFRIEAWDMDFLLDDFVAEATTGTDGRFTISFSRDRFGELFFDRNPDLYFKVYDGQKIIYSSKDEVRWNAEEPHLAVVITLDRSVIPGSGGGNSVVTGKVINRFGKALAGITVEAVIRTIGKNSSAGTATTGPAGDYSISYSTAAVPGAPDLQVKAYYPGEEQHASLSKIIYNATAKEVINIVAAAEQPFRTTEYETLLAAVKPHVADLDWSDLKENEEVQHITYLAGKTGWDARLIAMLITANQLGAHWKIDPPHLYALFRSGLADGTSKAVYSIPTASAKQAIETAELRKIIPVTGTLQHTLHVLSERSAHFLLNHQQETVVSTMSEMLNLRLNEDEQTTFLQAFQQTGINAAALWSKLEQNGFSAGKISQLQLDSKLGLLTGYNVPLMNRIYDQFNLENDVELVSSGLYKSSEWKSFIGEELPAGLTADQYAAHMASYIRLSYPTAVAGEMVRRNEINLGDAAPREEIAEFFMQSQASYKIGEKPLKQWAGYQALSEPAKSAAKRYERLYQITPSDEAMILLAEKGFESASQVLSYTQNEFLDIFGSQFPDAGQAMLTYTKASEVYSMVLNTAAINITDRVTSYPYVISGRPGKKSNVPEKFLNDVKEGTDYPTMEELFGNLDYCSCDNCRSVLSPAAYLVELLQLIDTPQLSSNPITALLARRPDIEHIQLSCENTNMALPYIDLVNEILEHYLLHGDLENLSGHDIAAGTKQSDLLAEPQFVEQEAYKKLKVEVYPYNLPFDQPLEVLRRLFQVWDVPLAGALQVFSSPEATEMETLCFSEAEYNTLTKTTDFPKYFGLPDTTTIGQLNAAIANGKAFCRATEISYDELVELLKTQFINPKSAAVPILLCDPASADQSVPVTCDFGLVTLKHVAKDQTQTPLTEADYHKFHRFLRLRRKTGWSMATLDQLLQVFLPGSPDTSDENFVKAFARLARFKQLVDSLSFSEEQYAALALIFDLTADLSLRKQRCAELLQLSLPELAELMEMTGTNPLGADHEKAIPDLRMLIEITQQLREQSLKIVDLAYLFYDKDLIGNLVPVKEALLVNIKALRDAMTTVDRENGDAPENSDFVFAKSKMLQVYSVAITDTFFDLLLPVIATAEAVQASSLPAELKALLEKIRLETTPIAQAQLLVNELLPKLRAQLKSAALQQTLAGILSADAETVVVLTSQQETVNSSASDLMATKPVLVDFTGLETAVILKGQTTYHFSLDVPMADDYLFFVAAADGTMVISLNIDGKSVISHQKVVAPQKEVKNEAPVALTAGIKNVEIILAGQNAAANPLQLSWRAKEIPKSAVPASALYTASQLDTALLSLVRLSKAVQLQGLFQLTAAELDYFAAVNAKTKGFLQVTKPADKKNPWEKIYELLAFNSLKNTQPEANAWIKLLKDPFLKHTDGHFLLEKMNRWEESDLDKVLARLGISRSALSEPVVLKKTMNAMALIKKIGFPAALSLTWITHTPDNDLVIGIKAAIRKKVNDASWLETMQTVSDPVRNLLRDALVSYILHYKAPSSEIDTPDKLYEYFLIDVEMSACMKTSRIRLALSTIQLFIQRCLMSLEAPAVLPEAIRVEQWNWMKRYRVWEANRKVFLYPENWLEPDLRDNKSSLFKELEGELLQGEITDESAELAYFNYLKKLDDIARLEMVGMYLEENEEKNQDDDILHVFGRTNGSTRQYYYRRYEYGYWTPWEKVSLNIEGEHLFPVIWKKQLFLFWLSITEKPTPVVRNKSMADMGQEEKWGENAKTDVELNMCWGEYYKGKWTSPKSTDLKKPMIIRGLSTFDSRNIQIFGRIEQVEYPAGTFREQLIFHLDLTDTTSAEIALFFIFPVPVPVRRSVTFTSKNAAPYVAERVLVEDVQKENEDANEQVKTFNDKLFKGGEFKLFSTQLFMPKRTFATDISLENQPKKIENILTKSSLLKNGFSVLPITHPIENQYEAPMMYADEHSTFFVRPEEVYFAPLPDVVIYYPPILIPEDIPLIFPEIDVLPDFSIYETPGEYEQWVTNPPEPISTRNGIDQQYVLGAEIAEFTFGTVKIGKTGSVATGINKQYQ